MVRILFFLLFFFGTLVAADAQELYDKPRNGEGISSFLERNNRPGRAYYREFLKLNKHRLHGKEELRLGVRYQLPPLRDGRNDDTSNQQTGSGQKPVKIHEPLFGHKLDDVHVKGSRLKGACFYVVSGHGGPDPGAIGEMDGKELHEDEYAYDVALRLARNLMQEGAQVYIIIQDKKDGIRNGRFLKNSKRETCMGDPIPLNQVERLKQRCVKINGLYGTDRSKYTYCRSIFLHVDSRSKRQQTDVFFYYAPGSQKGQRLASTMKNVFESKYNRHQPNRGFEGTVSERGLYVLQNSTPVAVFVELGNIQNSFDQRRFVISNNRQALANWMMEGFIADYNKEK